MSGRITLLNASICLVGVLVGFLIAPLRGVAQNDTDQDEEASTCLVWQTRLGNPDPSPSGWEPIGFAPRTGMQLPQSGTHTTVDRILYRMCTRWGTRAEFIVANRRSIDQANWDAEEARWKTVDPSAISAGDAGREVKVVMKDGANVEGRLKAVERHVIVVEGESGSGELDRDNIIMIKLRIDR